MLQRFVERIPEHVGKVHDAEGGNNYHEGKEGVGAREDARVRAATRRAFWRAKRRAKAAGIIDQFEADCARRWETARYGPEPVVETAQGVDDEVEGAREDSDWSDID